MTRVLCGPGNAQLEVKKSRFLASAARLADPEDAARLIKQLSDPEARHNCWAWRVGQQYRFHDAGEPGGTAGKPILAVIDGADLDQVVVVVTRHFGGIKLGTGGLVRAYGKAASAALREAPSEAWQAMSRLCVRAPIGRRSSLEHQLLAHQGVVLQCENDSSETKMVVSLPAAQVDEWRSRALQLCAGRVHFNSAD
jgi:uncharacterized YigZ family protein